MDSRPTSWIDGSAATESEPLPLSFSVSEREDYGRVRLSDIVGRGIPAVFGIAMAAASGAVSPTVGFPIALAAAESFSAAALGIRLPQNFQAALEEVEGYRGMREGWDGPRSIPPSDSVISAAEYFLSLLPSDATPPEAMASADGDAGWYWRTDSLSLSVLFKRDGRAVYYGQMNGRPIARGTLVLRGSVTLPADLLDAIKVA